MEINKTEHRKFSLQRNIAVAGFFLFIAKLYAWHITGSDAVFSDAMESIVNIIAAFMGLYSLYLAAKPKDTDHPYGHGKVEFITSGVEGALIIFAGIMIIIESTDSLLHGNTLKELNWGILIISLTAAVNYFLGYISYKKGVKENSLVLQSSGKHLQSDTLTTGGVVLSLILVNYTGLFWLDAVVAIVFGGYIIFVGYKIIRKSLKGIMDEADLRMVSDIAELLNKKRKREWIDVHNLKIQQYGSRLHIDGHITLPWYFELREAHSEMEEMIKCIAKSTDRPVEFNFHMDDCKPFSCEICQLFECQVRQRPFVKKVEWTVENIAQQDKHTVND
ncbi:cation diffusion facilitator family transporter [Chryseobacterium lacus]|uniref:cation diffusion facilitator family transporter n=1 Tax=Chryseobacterium lacus TaxID=2058346 RepID=UPI000F861041|nr:cation diffusion facilitator family transporter [Chryseobacterium lacus]RST25777.1 cation transporter [Chryseobacterium lacus]